MFDNLLWIFKAHRDAFTRIVELEHRIIEISNKAEHQLLEARKELDEHIAWSARQLQDLEEQLMKRPAEAIVDLANLEAFFQDQPYEGNKIPDDAWLTPGLPDRVSQ